MRIYISTYLPMTTVVSMLIIIVQVCGISKSLIDCSYDSDVHQPRIPWSLLRQHSLLAHVIAPDTTRLPSSVMDTSTSRTFQSRHDRWWLVSGG
jgi:hypothetical protein